VERVARVLAALEGLDLVRLAHHRAQQPAEAADDGVFEFEAAVGGGVAAPVGERQRPRRHQPVHHVAHPGVGVVAVRVDRGAGGQQAGDRVLAGEDHALDLVVEALEGVHGGGPTGEARSGRARC
jgi:hypothetical protein